MVSGTDYNSVMTESSKTELGKKLGEIRRLSGVTLGQLADRIGVTKSYLSKIENGHKPVPASLLQKYVEVYGDSAKFSELLGGHKVYAVQNNEGGRRSTKMDTTIQPATQELQVNLNPEKTPILYSDWQKVDTNDGGVVINFGQSTTPLPVQHITSRVGMSHAQARQLYNSLGDVLKQFYKSKDMEF